MAQKNKDIHVECPCCTARLTIDPVLGKVIGHEEPPRQKPTADLGNASNLLREQAARREALFQQSTETEKQKHQLLERKFEEALRTSKDKPRPLRDFDLD
jgi:hypothetical protein